MDRVSETLLQVSENNHGIYLLSIKNIYVLIYRSGGPRGGGNQWGSGLLLKIELSKNGYTGAPV